MGLALLLSTKRCNCSLPNVGSRLAAEIFDQVPDDKASALVANARGVTASDLALHCHCPLVERFFNVFLFEDYQLIAPHKPPLYKSKTTGLTT